MKRLANGFYITEDWYCEGLGDDPDKHRWRAKWGEYRGRNGRSLTFDDLRANKEILVGGIYLTAYPVIKLTKEAAWIDPMAYRISSYEKGELVYDWRFSPMKKLVYNNSGRAWAKPTREDALESLAIRLTRWAQKASNERQRINDATKVLSAVRPQYDHHAKIAASKIK